MADHPWLGPVVGTRLAVVVRRDPLETCETCDGNGVYFYLPTHGALWRLFLRMAQAGEPIDLDEESEYDCPCAEDSYRDPTPADLLGDPRVRALVEALRRVQGDYTIEEEEWRCVDEALAPFEVSRG